MPGIDANKQTSREAQELERLARTHLSELGEAGPSEAELRLLRAAPAGEVAYCGPSNRDNDPDNDPSHPDEQWVRDREIRAVLIRWLAVDRTAASQVDPKGILVHAAKITGALDLSFVDLPFPLVLLRCRLTGDASLYSAKMPFLSLQGSWVRSISAAGIDVKGDVFLRRGFMAEGEVMLLGAQVGGNLECTGGRFKNQSGKALSADRVDVKGDVFLREGFMAEGEVRLLGAKIGGGLDCSGGTFKNQTGEALNAIGIDVKGSVLLCDKFTAEGEVWLLGARIGGGLQCTGGTFNNETGRALEADDIDVKGSVLLSHKFAAEGEVWLRVARIGGALECSGGTFKNQSGKALTADHIDVKGDIFLSRGFMAEGEVRLLGAQIGGGLDCSGGTLRNPSGMALSADGIDVKGDVFLSEGFTAEGEVRLLGAQIRSNLDCSGGTFTNLVAHTATVKGNFAWFEIRNARGEQHDGPPVSTGTMSAPDQAHSGFAGGQLDLTNASVGALADDEVTWPESWPDSKQGGTLLLDGFVYQRILAGATDAPKRLQWLKRQQDFRPQPYRQLAEVLRETGDDRGARRVLYEMECKRRAEEDRGWPSKSWRGLLRLTNTHDPQSAILWVLALLATLLTKAWGRLLKWTIGYGYYPKWAFWWLTGGGRSGRVAVLDGLQPSRHHAH